MMLRRKKLRMERLRRKRLKMEKKTSKKDEESGETAVDRVKAKTGKTTLQLEDFLKHMKKVKTDLHTSIVKDVSKQTEKALKKTFSRSSSLSHDIEFKFCNVKGCSDTVIHKGITCDHCDLEIVGVRYKCGNCPDFDLCEKCESSEFVHDPTHVFLKLRKPARRAGCGTGKCVPLLMENLYEVEALHEMRRKEKEMKKEKEKRKSEEKIREKQDKETSLATIPSELQIEKLVEILQNVERMEKDEKMNSIHLDELPAQEGSVQEDVHCDAATPAVPVCRERFDSDTSKSNFRPLPSSLPTNSAQQMGGDPPQPVELLGPVEGKKWLLESSAGKPDAEEDSRSVVSDSSYEYYPDDGSDSDFSVISSPAREEYEEIGHEDVQEMIADRADAAHSSNSQADCPNSYSSMEVVPDMNEGFNDIKESLEYTNNEVGKTTVDDTQQMSDQSAVGEDENNNDHVHTLDVDTSEKVGSQDTLQEISAQEEVVTPEVVGKVFTLEMADATITEQKKSGKSSFGDLMKEVIEKATESDQVTETDKAYYKEMLLTVLAKEKQAEKQKGKDEKKDSEKKGKKELLRRHLESSLESQKKDSDKKGKKELLRRHLEKVKETDDGKRDQEDYLEILSVKAEQACEANSQLVETQSLNQESTMIKIRDDSALLYRSKRDKHLAEMLELERQKFAALNAGDLDTVDRIELRLQDMDHNMPETSWSINTAQSSEQSNGHTASPTELNDATFSHQNSMVSSSTESSLECGNPVKDADCQTNSEPVSHLIHNVATGMSKVMNSTISTAKDVFYSLQAKNAKKAKESNTETTKLEDKPAAENSAEKSWTPTQSVWTPSTDNWMPPQNTWVPPQNTWVPPKNNWVPPPDTWTPPPDMWFPPSTEQQSSKVDPDQDVTIPKSVGEDQTCENASGVETNLSINPTPMMQPVGIKPPITDLSLRSEMLGMQRLMEMGFANREQNRALLTRFDYDLEKVVQSLLQEDAQDPWFYRQQGQE